MSGARAQSDIKSEYEAAKETASAYLQAVGVLTPGAISMWEWPERVVKIMRDAILEGMNALVDLPNDPFAV